MNANIIFKSEKLDISDELVDAVKYLTINDAGHCESNIVTESDVPGNLTRNTETVTHTINGNETVTHTINGNCIQKLLSNRTIPVVVSTTNLLIYHRIAPISGTTNTRDACDKGSRCERGVRRHMG